MAAPTTKTSNRFNRRENSSLFWSRRFQPGFLSLLLLLSLISIPVQAFPQAPETHARTEAGSADGTADAPIPVQAGSQINYQITVYPRPAPMLRGNDLATTDWRGSSLAVTPSGSTAPQITKSAIKTATTVDLPDRFTTSDAPREFLNAHPTWKGKPVVAAWDATDSSQLGDPSSADLRAIAWVTEDDTSGYDLWIGGQGGVALSDSINAAGLFSSFSALTSVDLTWLHTDQAHSLRDMFNGCSSLTSLDLSNFDTAHVANMINMFNGCSSLTSLDLSNFDTSNVATMVSMFSGCPKLTSLDLSSFNTAKLGNASGMFGSCSALALLDLSNFDTSKVDNMVSMFNGCSSLTSLDLSNFDTSLVTYMNNMFANCSALTSLDISNFNTANVTTMSGMFNGCSKLTSLDLSSFSTVKVTDMSTMFQSCSSLTSLNLANFDTPALTNTASMFSRCSALTTLDLSSFTTSNVTNMSYLVQGCSKLPALDLSSFNTAKATNMSNMFQNCSSLTALDLSSFNTAKATTLSSMFNNCSSLTSLDLENFNTVSVTNMSSMFANCSSLSALNLSSFNTAKVTNMSSMFAHTDSLVTLHFENASFTQVTSSGSGTMFPAGNALVVWVGNTVAQSWLQTRTPAPATVVYDEAEVTTTPRTPDPIAPDPIAPTPWEASFVAPTSWEAGFVEPQSAPTTFTSVVDTLPVGLSIDPVSLSGIESTASVETTAAWRLAEQTVTWSVPSTLLPLTLSVATTVSAGLPGGTLFVNSATANGQVSNATYHEIERASYQITESFCDGSGKLIDAVGHPDTTYNGTEGKPFYQSNDASASVPARIGDWVYQGYRIDKGSLVFGEAPGTADDGVAYLPEPAGTALITALSANATIQYVYRFYGAEQITLQKYDGAADYIAPLEGARFSLYAHDSDGGFSQVATQTVVSSASGGVVFHNLVVGTYKLQETRPPSGYAAPSGYWVIRVFIDDNGDIQYELNPTGGAPELEAADGTYLVPNWPQTSTDFAFTKTNETGRSLSQVSFALYPQDAATASGYSETATRTASSTSTGTVAFTALPPGSYALKETATRAGYSLPSGSWIITVGDDFSIHIAAVGLPPAFAQASDGSYTLANYPQALLPSSGGTFFKLVLIISGVVCLGGAGLAAVRKRRAS